MVLTGTLTFSEFTFNFVFDENKLRIIPITDEKKVILFGWKKEKNANGLTEYIPQHSQVIEDEFIVGYCNETNSKIIFLPQVNSYISGPKNFLNPKSPISIPLSAYILFSSKEEPISRLAICCPEINYIHPITQAFEFQFNWEEFRKGNVSLNTKPFETTTTDKQSFFCAEKNVNVYFGISRSFENRIDEAPLKLTSTMYFEFEPTDDYSFILYLWRIARQFVRFLCYRKNICIPKMELFTPSDDGKHEKSGFIYLIEDDECNSELTALKNGRYIKQEYIAGHEGEILSDIVQNNIYTRHIPDTYASGRIIDAARFVMITAAFEWEFNRLYPEGVEHSESMTKAIREVETKLQELIENTKGKQKKIYKRLLKSASFDSLSSEICKACEDFSDIVGIFGEHLYSINNEKLDYVEMGERLANQRNNFAHGNIDKNLNSLSILDLVFLEFLIYAMQLKHYEIEDTIIQKVINELFRRNIALE